MTDVLTHAAEVVARCLSERRGAADVMAEMPALRQESDGVRAQVVRWTHQVIGARRRLRYLVGEDRPQDPVERARVYLMLVLIENERPVPMAGRGLPSRSELLERVAAIEAPDERFAIEHSVPDWLAGRFAAAFGDDSADVLRGLAEPAPRTLRANRLRIADREQLRMQLAEEGVAAGPAKFAADAVHVTSTHDLFRTDAYRNGWFEQQDEASQLAVLATAPPPGGKVLDLCCGSGGKTLGLAAALGNRGAILAADVHGGRVRELRRRLVRAGADNVQPLHWNESSQAEAALERFARNADRILIDAPCSGTGSWRRRPEARWAIDATALEEMQATQASLLTRAADWLKPGARLVYATCSLLPEENTEQLTRLRERCPDLEPVRLVEILGSKTGAAISDPTGTFLQVRPDSHGCDGFFLGVLRRPKAKR